MGLHKSKVEWADRCSIRDVLERIGDRWTVLVLFSLQDQGALRFGVLRKAIGDISQRMLSQTLRRLEQDGFISRTAYATVPPCVEYALTELGKSLLEPMDGLRRWADANHDRIRAARGAYIPPTERDAAAGNAEAMVRNP